MRVRGGGGRAPGGGGGRPLPAARARIGLSLAAGAGGARGAMGAGGHLGTTEGAGGGGGACHGGRPAAAAARGGGGGVKLKGGTAAAAAARGCRGRGRPAGRPAGGRARPNAITHGGWRHGRAAAANILGGKQGHTGHASGRGPAARARPRGPRGPRGRGHARTTAPHDDTSQHTSSRCAHRHGDATCMESPSAASRASLAPLVASGATPLAPPFTPPAAASASGAAPLAPLAIGEAEAGAGGAKSTKLGHGSGISCGGGGGGALTVFWGLSPCLSPYWRRARRLGGAAAGRRAGARSLPPQTHTHTHTQTNKRKTRLHERAQAPRLWAQRERLDAVAVLRADDGEAAAGGEAEVAGALAQRRVHALARQQPRARVNRERGQALVVRRGLCGRG